MADLIKQVPLVKVATIRRKDLEQISRCDGLRLDYNSAGVPYQQEAGKDCRELVVVGWFPDEHGGKRLLVQRVDDGRPLQSAPYWMNRELVIVERYPQLFVR